MTLPRQLLNLIDEAGVRVPRCVRNAVEAHERGETSHEGDLIKLIEGRVLTYPEVHARFRTLAATSPIAAS